MGPRSQKLIQHRLTVRTMEGATPWRAPTAYASRQGSDTVGPVLLQVLQPRLACVALPGKAKASAAAQAAQCREPTGPQEDGDKKDTLAMLWQRCSASQADTFKVLNLDLVNLDLVVTAKFPSPSCFQLKKWLSLSRHYMAPEGPVLPASAPYRACGTLLHSVKGFIVQSILMSRMIGCSAMCTGPRHWILSNQPTACSGAAVVNNTQPLTHTNKKKRRTRPVS